MNNDLSRTIFRVLSLILRTIQWLSTVVVFGISSDFVSKGPRRQHIIYWEVIVGLFYF